MRNIFTNYDVVLYHLEQAALHIDNAFKHAHHNRLCAPENGWTKEEGQSFGARCGRIEGDLNDLIYGVGLAAGREANTVCHCCGEPFYGTVEDGVDPEKGGVK